MSIKNFSDTLGDRTRDLLACSGLVYLRDCIQVANASPEGVRPAKKNGNRSYSRLSEQNVQTEGKIMVGRADKTGTDEE